MSERSIEVERSWHRDQIAKRDLADAAMETELSSLRKQNQALVEALRPFASGGNWGKSKAWLVIGCEAATGSEKAGLEIARLITKWQTEADILLASETKEPQ